MNSIDFADDEIKKEECSKKITFQNFETISYSFNALYAFEIHLNNNNLSIKK